MRALSPFKKLSSRVFKHAIPENIFEETPVTKGAKGKKRVRPKSKRESSKSPHAVRRRETETDLYA